MPKILQFRRGTTSELAQITGAEGEIFVNLDTKQIHVHDGNQLGGYPLASAVNPIIEGSITADSALIGTIGMIDNTISPTDAYGNAGTLTVDGSLQVSLGEITTTTVTRSLSYTSYMTWNGGNVVQLAYVPLENTSGLTDLIGKQVTTNALFDLHTYQNRSLRFTVSNVTTIPDPYNPSQYLVEFEVVGSIVEYSLDSTNWSSASNFYASGNTLQVSTSVTTNTLVTPLSVSNTGVAVEGTLTTNSISSTGQLNIDTNDGLNVVVDSTGTSTQTFSISGYPWMSGQFQFSNAEFYGVQSDANTALNYITTGDVVSLRNQQTGANVTFTVVQKTYDGMYWRLVSSTYLGTGEISASAGITVQRTVATTATPLVANAAGVAVTGTLTVNGQPVGSGGGTSYDQSLNTIDNVTFNSVTTDTALVGTMAMIDNTISPTDAYGNVGTLTVDGAMQVQVDQRTTYTSSNNVTFQIYGYDVSFFGTMGVPIGGNLLAGLYNNNRLSAPTVTLSVNHYSRGVPLVITGTLHPIDNYWWTGDFATVRQIYFNMSQPITVDGLPLQDFLNTYGNGYYPDNATITSVVGSIVTPLIANTTGVAVTGALTVNGQPVGTSYDQSLNTTDNVMFNSVTTDTALVGTMAMVDNTISPTDAYGNAGTLTINGDLDVTVGQMSVNQYSTSWMDATWGGTYANQISIMNPGSAFRDAVLALSAGDTLVFTASGGTQHTVTFVSATYDGMFNLIITVAENAPGASVYFYSSYPVTITSGSQTTILTANTTATQLNGNVSISGDVNISGNTTINGTTINPDSWLVVNQNGSKSVEVGSTATRTYNYDPMNMSSGLYWMSGTYYGSDTNMFGSNANKMVISDMSAYTNTAFQSLVAGDVVTFYYYNNNTMQTEPFNRTIVSTSYDGAFNRWTFVLVEPNNLDNPSTSINLRYGSGMIVVSASTATSVTFDGVGVTSNSITVDTALIGTMAMTDNTISPTDAYGNAGTLEVDGNVVIAETTATVVVPTTFTFGDQTGSPWVQVLNWAENVLGFIERNNSTGVPSTPMMQYINSLQVGDQFTLQWYTGSVVEQGTVTVTSAPSIYNDFNEGNIQATLNVDKTIGGAGFAAATINDLNRLVYTSSSLVTTPSNLTVQGDLSVAGTLTVDGELIVDGTLSLASNGVSTSLASDGVITTNGNQTVQVRPGFGVFITKASNTLNAVSKQINLYDSTATLMQGDTGSANYNFFAQSRDSMLGAKTLVTSAPGMWLTTDLANYPNGTPIGPYPGSYYMVNGEVLRVKARIVAATQPTTSFAGIKTWELNALVYMVNGVITVVEESKPSSSVGDTTGWDVVIGSSGNYIGLAVTGSTTADVHWSATWEQISAVITGAAGGK